MEGTYDLEFARQKVGSVRVERQGLYYRFSCRCTGMEGMYHLTVGDHKLGLLTPMGGQLGLDTRVPVKHLEGCRPSFALRPRHEPMDDSFVPIVAGDPFAYLRRLENAYLIRREGQLGIVQKNVK